MTYEERTIAQFAILSLGQNEPGSNLLVRNADIREAMSASRPITSARAHKADMRDAVPVGQNLDPKRTSRCHMICV